MPAGQLVLLGIVATIVTCAVGCVVLAPRLPTLARIAAALVFGGVGAFCAFGFLAAMEPGPNHEVWRVGYAVLCALCWLAVARLVIARSRRSGP